MYSVYNKVYSVYGVPTQSQARSDAKVAGATAEKLASHFFSTFFITKILENGIYNYARVMRWTNRFDIFKMDKIFLPVNINSIHWTLLVVFMQKKEIHYYDSCSGQADLYLKTTMQWIIDEGLEQKEYEGYNRKKIIVNKTEWKLLNSYPIDVMTAICTRLGAGPKYLDQQLQQTDKSTYVPQQLNGFDCGMYLCMNADFVADDIPLVGIFSQKHLPLLRLKIGTDILRGALNYTPIQVLQLHI